MIVFRCCLLKWSQDLSGTGSGLHGGRWNSPGTRLTYTAENNVLAALEVSLRIPLDHISRNYVMVPIKFPENVEIFSPRLPATWNKDIKISRQIGDSFAKENKYLLMKVPSALISDSFNYLINPAHDMMKKITAKEPRAILFDHRLMDMIRLKK